MIIITIDTIILFFIIIVQRLRGFLISYGFFIWTQGLHLTLLPNEYVYWSPLYSLRPCLQSVCNDIIISYGKYYNFNLHLQFLVATPFSPTLALIYLHLRGNQLL